MPKTKKIKPEEVRALARELHTVGSKTAQRLKPWGTMCKWDDLQPYVQAGHDAVARYVLRKFVRILK